ncbi:S8 family serine peptidase [Nonomuraea sp. NPDC050310]|uniref:S8 family peptidase n=1 Tax=unclassified Nonomuraea TaxID=2593643 RepID=UPI003410A4CF
MTWMALALLLGLVTVPADGPGDGPGAGSRDRARTTYVVALRRAPDGDAGRVGDQAARLARKYGGRIHHVYAAALRGFSATMTPAQARRLAADRRVARVEPNRVFTARTAVSRAGSVAPVTSWGLDRVNQRGLPLDGLALRGGSAAGVTAYVIDSGLRTTHTEFGGRAKHGFDAIESDSVAQDCFGHGTHVAATLGGATYGVAKDVGLVAVRVLDCDGTGTTADMVAGIDWVTRNATRPAVVNMSLQSGRSRVIDRAVRSSIASGLPYVVAAGNGGQDACRVSPAWVREAITVGASTRTDTRGAFSNRGRCLDLFAPGAEIPSAWNNDDNGIRTASGTSMASPHVAGAVALLLGAQPQATPAQLHRSLLSAATISDFDGGSPGRLLYIADSDDRR